MDTYTLTRRSGRKLSWTVTERYVAMMICLHFNRKMQFIQVTKEEIATECGVKPKTVQGVIKKLIQAQFFERKRILGVDTLVPLNNLKNLENDKSANANAYEPDKFRDHGQKVPSPRTNPSFATDFLDEKAMPWEHDLAAGSTHIEEEHKRPIYQFEEKA